MRGESGASRTPKGEMKKQLQVMKFGGTSVGDPSCISRAAKIIVDAARDYRCVAVVSAMSGVTNRLIEAANHARTGNGAEATAILEALRKQHETALVSLIPHEKDREGIRRKLEEVLAEGRRLCEGTAERRHASEACIIQGTSWREAAELASRGGKVLHPKGLTAISQEVIALWIRNSCAPERAGRKIRPGGRRIGGAGKGLTAIRAVT